MFKLFDSGCGQHRARHLALKGVTAALVGRLLLHLPLSDGRHYYICEHGHTHHLTLHQGQEESASNAPPRERAGGAARSH
jgi:hypothetical protein